MSSWVLFIALITNQGGVTSSTIFFLDQLTCEHVRGIIVGQVEALKPRTTAVALCIQTDQPRR